MNISLVMIAKNEEGGLERAIKSALPIVNEVIIGVDSKSTDDTLKIAKKYGTDVFTFDWQDNFAKARNDALERSHGDWNLILDGHEYITQYPEISLLEYPDNTDCFRAELEMENGEIISSERILRKDVRYKSAIHNEPQVKRPHLLHDLKIKHDRRVQSVEVLKARDKQRAQMLKKLMRGDTFRAHWYLGNEFRGQNAGKAAWHYRKAIAHRGNASQGIVDSARYYLAQMLYEDGKVKSALGVVDDSLMEFGHVKGLIYFREKQYAEAVKEFVSALGRKKLVDVSRPVQHLEFEIYDFLSQCFYQLGLSELASVAAQKALDYKDDLRVRTNLSIFRESKLATEEKGEEYYDKIFAKPYNTSRYKDLYKVVMGILQKYDKPSVLEPGCGTGTLGKMILEAGYEYRGFDFSQEAIKKCGDDEHFFVGNVYDKTLYNSNYDVVIVTEVLEHVDDLRLVRNIKSGVKLIASVPTFGDSAHLRVYRDQQKDIVDRFAEYLDVENILFSEKLGIYIFEAMVK